MFQPTVSQHRVKTHSLQVECLLKVQGIQVLHSLVLVTTSHNQKLRCRTFGTPPAWVLGQAGYAAVIVNVSHLPEM
jgi:hypothetical protein